MSYATIVKPPHRFAVQPNLSDYEQERQPDFWERARAYVDGLPTGGLNIAHEAVDRHAMGLRAGHVALRWLGKTGDERELTYEDLRHQTNRFANVLAGLGVGKGDVVCTLAGRIPELYVTALGAMKHRAVYCPLFSQFGPEPVKTRLTLGGARVLVTSEALYARKVAAMRDELPDLAHVILVGEGGTTTDVPGTLDWGRLMVAASDDYEIDPTDPEDIALLHFTSGTTGAPKGAVHVHEAIVVHVATGRMALDLHPEDVFWCTADPGWVTGTSYGIIAPLANGVTNVVDEAEYDAERWYAILAEQQVTVWYTAPTAIRRMMKAGVELVRAHEYPALRFLASVGEPLNPEGVVWGEEAFGLPFHDNWWQTETGGIMIANFPTLDIRPGSMGRAMPGIEAAVVRRTEDGVELVEEPDAEGILALRPGWPSMFRTYLNEPERYAKAFAGGWYLSGDLARRDEDGYFWFVGRADDVIKTSGHLIGPFEVENAMLEHEAVAEAGVIGVPDPVAGEVVKAFVTLRDGFEPSRELEKSLLAHARVRLGPVVAPKEIDIATDLPRTRSGKIRGFLHLYIGEEACAVGAMQSLTPADAVVATYRDHGHALARGLPARELMAEMYGKAAGCSRGRGGSMHFFDASRRFYGGYGIVGGGLPIAVGLALADRMQGRAVVTACFFGEGAAVEGEFHEALNLAALWRLPVLFLCENNHYAMGTVLEHEMSRANVAEKAATYGIHAQAVDGMDVLAVEAAVRAAVDGVRRGEGPQLVELMTYRFRAHSMADPDLYRTKEEVEEWRRERDPIDLFSARLRENGLLDDAALAELDEEVAAEIAEATAFADAAEPEALTALGADVYAGLAP